MSEANHKLQRHICMGFPTLGEFYRQWLAKIPQFVVDDILLEKATRPLFITRASKNRNLTEENLLIHKFSLWFCNCHKEGKLLHCQRGLTVLPPPPGTTLLILLEGALQPISCQSVHPDNLEEVRHNTDFERKKGSSASNAPHTAYFAVLPGSEGTRAAAPPVLRGDPVSTLFPVWL